MSSIPKIDPMVVFFAERGLYLQTRQTAFCHNMLDNGNYIRSARLAGYPNPTEDGYQLYMMYRTVLEEWRQEQQLDMELALAANRRAAAAHTYVIAKENEMEDFVDDDGNRWVRLDDHSTQLKGSAGLAKLLGLNAAEKQEVDLTHKAGISPTMREFLDSVYNPERG